VRGLVTEVCDGVYSFPLLDVAFCEKLVQHGEAFQRFAAENGVSDVVGAQKPLVLDTMKLKWLTDVLFKHVLQPLSLMLLPEQTEGEELDWRHAYIAGYESPPPPRTRGGTLRRGLGGAD